MFEVRDLEGDMLLGSLTELAHSLTEVSHSFKSNGEYVVWKGEKRRRTIDSHSDYRQTTDQGSTGQGDRGSTSSAEFRD